MLLRCPCDAEDLKPAEEDCQRHKRGEKRGRDGTRGKLCNALRCVLRKGGVLGPLRPCLGLDGDALAGSVSCRSCPRAKPLWDGRAMTRANSKL